MKLSPAIGGTDGVRGRTKNGLIPWDAVCRHRSWCARFEVGTSPKYFRKQRLDYA